MEGCLQFYILVGITEAFAVACVALVLTWTVKYESGFAWDGSGKMFNYHPLFMVLGMVVFYGNAAISYRVLRFQEKSIVKILHAVLQFCTFIFAVLGLVAVFRFHNHNDIPNVYSIHSWIGIGTVVLFSLQLFSGFFAFLFPILGERQRASYLTVHAFFGAVIFTLVVVSCISGITEKLLFEYSGTYSNFPPVTVVANSLGIAIVVFALLVGYILYHPSYKRITPGYTDMANN